MSLIEREHLRDSVSPGQHHDRSDGDPNREIGVLLDYLFGSCNVSRAEWLQLVCAASDLVQQCRLRAPATWPSARFTFLGI